MLFVDDERCVSVELFREQCKRFGFDAAGCCVITNQIHLVGTPALEDSLSLVSTGWSTPPTAGATGRDYRCDPRRM